MWNQVWSIPKVVHSKFIHNCETKLYQKNLRKVSETWKWETVTEENFIQQLHLPWNDQ